MIFANKRHNALRAFGLVVAAAFASGSAFAVGTEAGTTVTNRASVAYDVGGITQTPIESSPTGNSTPGVGNGEDTTFLVDNRVNLTLVEQGGAATPVNPGQTNAVATFLLTNTGNFAQGYALTAANLADGTAVHGNADNSDVNNLRIFADTDGSGDFSAGDQPFVDTLAADASVLVFVVADVPIGATNGDFSNVSATATTAVAGTSGATAVTETVGGDDPNAVDVVFADAGNDGAETDQDGYEVSSAALTVTKAETLLSDPINGTTDPLHIPGAVIEYSITVVNTGTADATAVGITDVLEAELSILLAQYNGGASDIQYTLAGVTAFCTADAGDADADSCGLTGATLEADLGATLGTNAGVDNTLVVSFQVTIN
ncbi:MAG: hypothetical protein AAAFM81_12670 [Pseudomonadota bacterium]